MEVNATTTVPAGPPRKNHTFIHHYHHLHSEKHYHSHGHFSFKTILIAIIFVALIMLIFTIFMVVWLIRRQKSSKENGTSKDDSESRVLHDKTNRLMASTIMSFDSSPGNYWILSINC